MDGFKTIWMTFAALMLLSACVPEENKTSCGEGERLNTSLRTCEAVVNIPVGNKAPVGIDQNITTVEDTISNFTLDLATDPDGDTISYQTVTTPSHGTLTHCMDRSSSIGPTDRNCRYTPSANFSGTDSFTYKIYDGYQYSAQNITVFITVSSVNDAPIIFNQLPFTSEDVPFTYTISYFDSEADLATSCSVANASNVTLGSCLCSAFGVCTVDVFPGADLNSLVSSFSFEVTITAGVVSNALTEILDVFPVNDLPVLTEAACNPSVNEDTALACSTPTVSDIDSTDTHTWSLHNTLNTCSWVSINSSTGSISGTPSNQDVGTCNFVYTVSDGTITLIATTITLIINNVAPILTYAASSLVTPVEDSGKQLLGKVSSLTGCAEAFCLSADHITDGTLSIDSSSTCSGLALESTADANVKNLFITPAANFSLQNGQCNVSLRFNDGHTFDIDTASIHIQEINDAPTMTDVPSQSTNEATLLTIDTNTSTTAIDPIILDEGGGSDEDGQQLSIKVTSSDPLLIPHSSTNIKMYADVNFSIPYSFVSTGAAGTIYASADGNNENLFLVLSPVAGRSGTTTITVVVTDNGTTNGNSAPLSVTKSFTVTVSNSATIHNDWSEIFATGAKVLYDGTVANTPVVRLGWPAFTAFNDTISGYHVFRSTQASGPFITQVNSALIPAADTLSFTDPTLTEADEGVTYYYRVKAVSANNGQLMDTSSSYSTLRIPIPLHNMSLVHRRMANKDTCTAMAKTPDKSNHNRCAYVGPGDNYEGIYDIRKDHFVDSFEASCNYTQNNFDCAETNSRGCIGAGVPVTGIAGVGQIKVTPLNHAIYYNRLSGACYYFNSSWKTIASLSKSELENFALLNQKIQDATLDDLKSTFPAKPPLVLIKQFQAYNYCSAGTTNPSFGMTDKTLITRQIHMAASTWSSENETGAADLETGADLSSELSQCNASSGGSLIFQFSLNDSHRDSWTGTNKAGSPRFVMAGSDATEDCVSKYGIQDLVGNVEEWNTDRYFARGDDSFHPIGSNVTPSDLATSSNFLLNASYNPYSYKDATPLSESTPLMTPGLAIVLATFTWGTPPGVLTDMIVPFGLPSLDEDDSLLASTVTTNEDSVIFETNTLLGSHDNGIIDNELAALASGGKFDSEVAAGRYALRFRTICDDADNNGVCDAAEIEANGTEENLGTGFRCMLPIPN